MTGEPFAPASTTSAEVCDNFVDDDGDGLADAEDPEGCSLPSGGGNETSSEGFGDSLTPGSILPPETQSLTEGVTDPFSDGTVPGFGEVTITWVR